MSHWINRTKTGKIILKINGEITFLSNYDKIEHFELGRSINFVIKTENGYKPKYRLVKGYSSKSGKAYVQLIELLTKETSIINPYTGKREEFSRHVGFTTIDNVNLFISAERNYIPIN